MKKRNILFLVVFSCISIFLGMKVVRADDVTMYIECTYNISYGTIKDSGPIYVMYTALVDEAGDRFQIKAKKTAQGEIDNIGDISGYFGFNVNDSADSNTTFALAMSSNSGECPLYMTVEYKDRTWGSNNYKVLFYNKLDDSSTCSGEPGSKCMAYFKNVATVKNVKINPDEDKWTHYSSATNDDICSDLTNVITIKNNQIYAWPTYGRNTKYVEGINWNSAQKVKKVWFTDIANLALNNTISSAIFDPDTDNFAGSTDFAFMGGTRVYWTALDVSFCTYTNALFTRGKNCTEFSNIEATAASKFTDLQSYIISLKNQAVSVGALIKRNNQKYYSIDYDYVKTSNEAETIYNPISSFLETALTPEEFYKKIEEYQKELETLLNGVCKSEIEKMKTYIDKGNDLGTEYSDLMDKIAATVGSLANKLAESGKEDLAQEAYEVQEATEKKASVMREYTLVLQENFDLISGINLNLTGLGKTGCDILSSDLKSFLNTILWYIRIVGVVLAIILSLLDYIKAAAGSDEKSMSAANKRFVTRMLLVAVLFLIPVLLEFVLGALNISTTAGSLNCL